MKYKNICFVRKDSMHPFHLINLYLFTEFTARDFPFKWIDAIKLAYKLMYKYFRSKRHSFEPNLMQEPLNRMNFIQMFRYYYFPVKKYKMYNETCVRVLFVPMSFWNAYAWHVDLFLQEFEFYLQVHKLRNHSENIQLYSKWRTKTELFYYINSYCNCKMKRPNTEKQKKTMISVHKSANDGLVIDKIPMKNNSVSK